MSENPSTWGELAGLTLTKGHGTGEALATILQK